MTGKNEDGFTWPGDGPLRSEFPRISFGLNGNQVCTMGIERCGVISLFITYANVSNRDDIDENAKPIQLNFRCVGLEGAEPRYRFLYWAEGTLTPGDELVYRPLPPGEFDAPANYAIHERREIRERETPWPFSRVPEVDTLPDLEGRSPRFAVYVNGSRICTAAIERFGVLSFILGYNTSNPERTPDEPRCTDDDFYLHMGGLDQAIGDGEHVKWSAPNITPGDEIIVQILEPGTYDPCDEHHPRDAKD